MGQDSSSLKSGQPKAVARKQCPYCGFNNKYDLKAGTPAQCEICERKFADPMEARAAYDAMFGRGFWFKLRPHLSALFNGPRSRLVLLGVAFGVIGAEIGRRLWAE